MSRREVFPGQEAIEPFAEYSARVVLDADKYARDALSVDVDPGLAKHSISSLKFTLDKDCFDQTGGLISSVSFYELGPSAPRSVRGIECSYPIDEQGFQQITQLEWDYLEPTAESRQAVRVAFRNVETGVTSTRHLTTGFTEEDLRTIKAGIQGYTEDSDAQT